MKKIPFIFLLLLFQIGFSQEKSKELYIIGQDTLSYTRIDYSGYGIAQIYITMYEETEETTDLIPKSSLFLRGIPRLYHTLYFFLPLKKEYTFEHKEKLFLALTKYILVKENLNNISLYLNFDEDYSKKYLEMQMQGKTLPTINRIKTKIKPKRLRKFLLN